MHPEGTIQSLWAQYKACMPTYRPSLIIEAKCAWGEGGTGNIDIATLSSPNTRQAHRPPPPHFPFPQPVFLSPFPRACPRIGACSINSNTSVIFSSPHSFILLGTSMMDSRQSEHRSARPGLADSRPGHI